VIARLIVTDLVAGWRTWLGAFVVLVLSGVVALVCAGDVSTASAMGDTEQAAALANHAKIYAGMNAPVVIGGVAVLVGFVVRSQRTRHALWQFAGLTPRLVAAVVLGQVATVALLTLGVAALVVVPFLDLLLNGLSGPVRSDPDVALVTVTLAPGPVAVAALVHIGTAVVSAAVAARRAARTPALHAVRAPADETTRPGVARLVVALLLGLGATAMYAAYLLGDQGLSSMFAIVFVAAAACAAPWLVAPLLRAWTALVPARSRTTWFLARRAALHSVSRSQASVTLVTVAAALGAFTGSIGLWNDPRMFFQGLALFGVPVAVVLVTAVMTVFMTAPERRRETAALVVAGVTWRSAALAAGLEGLISVVTAGVLALVLALPSTVSPFVGQVPLDAVRPLPWVLLIGAVLLVSASVAPVLTARRHTLVAELRVPA